MVTLLKIYHFIDFHYKKFITRIQLLFIRVSGGKPKIFMMNIPEHANMGDQAIVLAEKEFFKHYFDAHYYEVSDLQWLGSSLSYRRTIRSTDLICIHGGGYIGDIWPGAERMAKQVIDSFPNVRKVMMPNTIHFYSDDVYQTSKSLSYYDKENLFMFLRDKASYDKAKEAGIENIALVPDTVCFMEKNAPKGPGCIDVLFCMRDDVEKSAGKEIIDKLNDILKHFDIKVKHIDTVNKHGVRWFNRRYCVNKKIAEFQKARLVITDRLHGMYFAAITGTPCIALDNISKKVSGGAYWLKDLPYVRVYDDNSSDIEEFIKKALSGCNCNYSRGNRMKMFDEEARIIKSFGKVE